MQAVKFNGLEFGNDKQYNLYSFTPNEEITINRQTQSFFGIDGQTVIDNLYDTRVISLEGDIIADNQEDMFKQRKELCKTCNGKNSYLLEYTNDYDYYKAYAVAEIPKFERTTSAYCHFVITFNIFDFYWLSEDKQLAIGARIPLIKDTFTLPCQFSEISTQNIISNDSNVDTYFKTIIDVVSNTNSTITLKNITTNKQISITYTTGAGAQIVIDTKQCTVTLNGNINLINYLSTDSEFWSIAPGDNVIELTGDVDSAVLNGRIDYNILYVGV